MKKLVTIVFMLLFCSLQAEVITYSENLGSDGFRIEQQNQQNIELTFSLSTVYLEDQIINGENLKTVHVPGIFLPNDAGAPDLPGTSRYIAVPQGAEVSVEVLSWQTERLSNVDLAPAPRIPLDTDPGPLEYRRNSDIYSADALYPQNPVKLSDVTQIRGVDVVLLGITPFQYNPVSKELIIYKDIDVRLNFSGGNGQFGENRLRSRWWDPLLRDMILNQEVLPPVEYTARSELLNQDFEYLIITPDNPDYLRWADSIRVFRSQQGIRTGIVTLTDIGGNSTSQIEAYIDNAYNNWNIPPAAILFMADYGTGPATGNGIVSPVYDSYCISDHLYADVNGNHMADIVVARMTAQNAQQLEIMVRKVLDYETQPPTNPGYYDHPVSAMGWQTERWFQICSETINGFWEHALGKQPVRENAIYSGTPSGIWSSNSNTSIVVDYFGPNGLGYIPATPNHLTDWGGNETRLNNDINSGAFMVQHRDHGLETGWGEPYYRNSSLSGLNNNDLTFIFSINCLTGQFDWSSESFAEAFHRYPKRALGIIAATEVSYSFVNDTYVWGLYDNMWPDFMPAYGTTPSSRGILPAFGNAAGKYFLQQSSWPYNSSSKEVTYYLFHHHGDAFTTVYSEIPQSLTVTHAMVLYGGQSSFSVMADSDALIALTVNDEIIGVATGTGGPVSITIPPQIPGNHIKVTVTKQNYYRYSQEIPVIAATGPYLYCLNSVTNDSAGNDNGIPEAGETVELKLQLTNLGVENATNITGTLSCSDTLLTIYNNGVSSIVDVDTTDTLICGSFSVRISEKASHLQRCILDLQLEADSAGVPAGYQWQQPVPLTIREGAKIGISVTSLAFPSTFLNFTSGLPLTISNTGPDTLFVRDIIASNSQFTVSHAAFTVSPGEQEDIQVLFTPDDTLEYQGTLTIHSTDPVQYECSFQAGGKGIFAPDIHSQSDTVTHVMRGTDSTTVRVTLENQGLGELLFNAQIAGWDASNTEGAGGSDTYGHMWIDSDEPNGPTFDWVDIRNSGTAVMLTGNNSISNKMNIGFPFEFYGVPYEEIRACTNGWLSFTTFSVAYNNFVLPNNLAPRAMLAPVWDDLNFQPDSKLYYQNENNRFIVMYENVYRLTGEGPYTFEIILYDNGNVVFQYLELENLVDDYTVGIQNHTADDGLTIAHNASYLHDSLTVLISRATWLSVSPMSGVIAGQSSTELELTLVTTEFPEGDFWASLQIQSNDPDEELYVIPVHLMVDNTVGIDMPVAEIPRQFRLSQNIPNPFNPATVIAYDLPEPARVELVVFNMLGQRVKTLVSGKQAARHYEIRWDGTNENGVKTASGIYIYQLRAGKHVFTRKMILMK